MEDTKSERLFRELCESIGVTILKIDTTERRTADFQIEQDDVVCIAEVKQFEANDEERRSLKELERSGSL